MIPSTLTELTTASHGIDWSATITTPRQLNYVPFGRAVDAYAPQSDRRRRREANRLAKLPQPYAPLPEYGDWPAEQYEPTPMSLMVREPIAGDSSWNAFPKDSGITKALSGIAMRDSDGLVMDGKSSYATPSQAQLDYNRTVTNLSSVLALPAPGQTTFGSWTSKKQIKAIKRATNERQVYEGYYNDLKTGKTVFESNGDKQRYVRTGKPAVAAHAQGL